MVSFVITSCLDDDNDIEYSPDATIHAFELDKKREDTHSRTGLLPMPHRNQN